MLKPFVKARSHHLRLGRKGENAASRLLYEKKAEILARNYKRPQGEIDIVARDGSILVFAEVKTRSLRSLSRPARNLSLRQKRRIYHAAMIYLREIGSPEVVFRFDLIEVVFDRTLLCEIRHWPSHFSRNSIFF